jgi:hypothetical protein
LGALLASSFYKIIKILKYETVNPGQDDDGLREFAIPFTDSPAGKGHGDNASGSQGGYGAGPSIEAGRSE